MFNDLKYNESGTIDMVMDHPLYGPIPFTASPDDPEEHGRQIYHNAVSGIYGPIAEYAEEDNG